MKQTVRLNENKLKHLIRESVKTMLSEWDEYNEFDRNGNAGDVDPFWAHVDDVMNRLYSGEATKSDFEEVLRSPDDFLDKEDYEELRKIYPDFIKRVENELSWRDIDNNHFIDDKLTLGTDFEHGENTYAGNGSYLAADRGIRYGDDFGSDGRDYRGSVKNDMNLNVYDANPGVMSMKAQGGDRIAKNVRGTIRQSFDAGKLDEAITRALKKILG